MNVKLYIMIYYFLNLSHFLEWIFVHISTKNFRLSFFIYLFMISWRSIVISSIMIGISFSSNKSSWSSTSMTVISYTRLELEFARQVGWISVSIDPNLWGKRRVGFMGMKLSVHGYQLRRNPTESDLFSHTFSRSRVTIL